MEPNEILDYIAHERSQASQKGPYGKIHLLPLELTDSQSALIEHFGNALNVSKRIHQKVGIKPQCVIPLSVFDSLANSTSGQKVWEWMIDLRNISAHRTVPISVNGKDTLKKIKVTNFLISWWRDNNIALLTIAWLVLAFCLYFVSEGLSVGLFFGSPVVWITLVVYFYDKPVYTREDLKRRVIQATTSPFVLLTQHLPEKGCGEYWICRPCGQGTNKDKVYKDYLNPSDKKAKLIFKAPPEHFEKSFDKVLEAKLQPCILSAPGMIGLVEESIYQKIKNSVHFEDIVYNTDPVLYVIEEEGGIKYAVCLDYYGLVEERFVQNAKVAYRSYFSGLYSQS